MTEPQLDDLSRLMRARKRYLAARTPAAQGVTLGELYRLAHETSAPVHYVRFVLRTGFEGERRAWL